MILYDNDSYHKSHDFTFLNSHREKHFLPLSGFAYPLPIVDARFGLLGAL